MPRGSKRKLRGKRSGKGRKKGSRRGGLQKPNQSIQHQRVMADRNIVHLQYVKQINLNNAGAGDVVSRLQWNGAFDIDPLFGSVSMPGYTNNVNFYDYYRVRSVKYTCTVSNLESFPIFCSMFMQNVDSGTSDSSSYQHSALPHRIKWQMPQKASARDTQKRTMRMGADKLLGDHMARTDSTLRSTVVSNPTDLLWCGFVLETSPGNVLVSGVELLMEVTVLVQFFSTQVTITDFSLDLIAHHRKRYFSNMVRAMMFLLYEFEKICKSPHLMKRHSDPDSLLIYLWRLHAHQEHTISRKGVTEVRKMCPDIKILLDFMQTGLPWEGGVLVSVSKLNDLVDLVKKHSFSKNLSALVDYYLLHDPDVLDYLDTVGTSVTELYSKYVPEQKKAWSFASLDINKIRAISDAKNVLPNVLPLKHQEGIPVGY